MPYRTIFPAWIIALCLLFLPLTAVAQGGGIAAMPQVQQALQSGQISPAQVRQAQQALQSGQISPAQIEQAIESGQVTPEKVRQLVEETKQANSHPAKTAASRSMLGEMRPAAEEKGKKEAEDKARQSQLNNLFSRIFGKDIPGLDLFGHALFSGPAATFAPLKDTPVTNDYIIGPGDAINVLMWGRLDATYDLEVDSEGLIKFPQIGPIAVAGLTYKEVKELIGRKAEAITGVNVSVSMGRLRTIQVFVLGEVRRPGLQTVSSLATAINALLSSGGPTELGSLRNVQLKRQGRTIVTLDLYDLLLKGDITKDIRLMPADVIFIPQVGPLVAVSGNVKRPAVYELRETRTLRTALDLAGGLAPRAYNQRIQIQRAAANQLEVIVDIPEEKVGEYEEVALQDGDIVKVFSIVSEIDNAVYLYGNVLRPGEYAYREGLCLLDIIPDLESLDEDTYFDYALIKRYHREDMSTELIPFDLGKLLSSDSGKQNIPLMPLDEVYVFNKWQLEDKPQATITGEVRKPGTYSDQSIKVGHQTQEDAQKGMRVSDLIFRAGNLTRDAFLGRGHIFRTDRRTKEVTILTFNVEKALAGDPEQDPALHDQDRVVIHSTWENVEKYTVSVEGMVNNPGTYPYASNLTVRDLILVGGNVKEGAYLDQGELVRRNIVQGEKFETTVRQFNVKKALTGDPEHNLVIAPWDSVYIKKIQDWGETKQVTVAGEVLFPGVYTVRKDERLSSVIQRAGGFTGLAYFRGAKFTRDSVRILQQKRLDEMIERLGREMAQASASDMAGALSQDDVAAEQQMVKAQQSLLARIKAVKADGRVVVKIAPGPVFVESTYDVLLEDGDQLSIPAKPDTIAVAGEVFNPTTLIFDPRNPKVKHYLAQTGGPTNYAEEDQMYIVRADGTVVSKAQGNYSTAWMSSFENNTLYPGDTLVVPPKLVHGKLRRDIKDWTSIIYQIAVSTGIILQQVF